MRKFFQILGFVVVLVSFSSPAFAGPVGDAIEEAGRMVGAAEDALKERVGEVVDKTAKNVDQILGEVARNVQGHIDSALKCQSAGDEAGARAHALAAQYEIRRVSDLLGLGLAPLTAKQIADKAGKDAQFKAAVAKLPPGTLLITGPCKTPNYGRCAK